MSLVIIFFVEEVWLLLLLAFPYVQEEFKRSTSIFANGAYYQFGISVLCKKNTKSRDNNFFKKQFIPKNEIFHVTLSSFSFCGSLGDTVTSLCMCVIRGHLILIIILRVHVTFFSLSCMSQSYVFFLIFTLIIKSTPRAPEQFYVL